MAGIRVEERKLISMLDVTDVIRRVTKNLEEKGAMSEYHHPGAHFTAGSSLWQTSG